MNTANPTTWQKTPITLETWKANCQASSHVRDGDKLSFNEGREGISCFIKGTSVFLGAFFPKGDGPHGSILPNTGWNHL